MANINDFVTSKYLKKSDLGSALKALFTVKGWEFKNVAQETSAPDRKCVVYFNETDKAMALNKTNLFDFAAVMRSDDPDVWAGKKIVVYYDENVRFKSERVGGLRVRAPASGGKPAPEPPPVEEEMDGEIPFN